MPILLDLEATCWDGKEKSKQARSEIIEISAIFIDSDFNISEIFSEFIKPKKQTVLSDFCINLTGINQQDIDCARSFTEVINDFNEWLLSYKDHFNNSLVVWGNYDKTLLEKNFKINKYHKGEICYWVYGNRVFDLQNKFEETMYMSKGQCSLSKALSIVGEPFLGNKHSGINDVKNMLKIYQFVYRINQPKFIARNKLFVDYINEIRERNLQELKERELRKEQKRLKKLEKQKQYREENSI